MGWILLPYCPRRLMVTPDHRHQERRSLFRTSAVERYLQNREAAVLPRLVHPRTLAFLWLLFVFLMAAGWIAWSTHLPIFDSGSAIVTKSPKSKEIIFVALFSPNYLSRLKVGETIFLTTDGADERTKQTITAVERNVLSPTVIVRQFDMGLSAAANIGQPAAVVTARFEPPTNTLDLSSYLGSVYQAEVEVGSRRVVSLLPVIGRFFGTP